ncbi:unnamed protein product [Caenorhabditis angaria]|uniref:Uncharacterized protein n=1 Tax=Caenorhabditis angaria TaxID=860376 RepID=A0A9P1I5A2_9PELO|nr:unnamed protein product [Caenorhabditis angaria]
MLRSLCCANRTAKVADVAGVAAAANSTKSHDEVGAKRAIVMCSDVVLHRGLLGKFLGVLEDKCLVSSELRIEKPSHDAISKSKLLPRNPPEILAISEWTGDDVAQKISDATKHFRQQYALATRDLCFCIETSMAEHKLWFGVESAPAPAAENAPAQDSTNSFSTGNGPGMENLSESTTQPEESEQSEAKPEEIVREPLDKDQVSSIGPNPSINSEMPEVEVVSNTVDAILPAVTIPEEAK